MKDSHVQIMNTSGLSLPEYQTDGSAGFDIRANVSDSVTIAPHQRHIIPTGLHISLMAGFELQLRGRSGLAAKYGIGLVNGVGTIDSDYRGEIRVILINHGDEPFTINRGDRIAQGVVSRYERITWREVDNLEESTRGLGGFGSTGSD